MVTPSPVSRRRWSRSYVAICDGSPVQTPPSATGRRSKHRHLRRVAGQNTAICDGSALPPLAVELGLHGAEVVAGAAVAEVDGAAALDGGGPGQGRVVGLADRAAEAARDHGPTVLRTCHGAGPTESVRPRAVPRDQVIVRERLDALRWRSLLDKSVSAGVAAVQHAREAQPRGERTVGLTGKPRRRRWAPESSRPAPPARARMGASQVFVEEIHLLAPIKSRHVWIPLCRGSGGRSGSGA